MHTAKPFITVAANIKAGIDKTWKLWNTPEHIMKWNHASPDWHTPRAENDLREGGKFSYRMEARDQSFGFDFEGVYDRIKPKEFISYTIIDGRRVEISFSDQGNATQVTEVFEPETENSLDLQRMGWQAILDNFKKYVEEGEIADV